MEGVLYTATPSNMGGLVRMIGVQSPDSPIPVPPSFECQKPSSTDIPSNSKLPIPIDNREPDLDDKTRKKYVNETGTAMVLRPWLILNKELDAEGYGEIRLRRRLPRGDLQNDIHPLFAPARFPLEDFTASSDSKLWKDLEPALRLASRLLLSAPSMEFFRKLKYGSQVTDPNTGRTYLQDIPNFPIDQANKAVLQDLHALSTKLNLVFAAIKPNPEDDAQVHAIHYVSQADFNRRVFLRGDTSRLPPDTGTSHYIVINEAYHAYFTRSYKRTQTKDFRTRFLLATTLVHEVAHAFYARDRNDGWEDYVEPFFDLEQGDAGSELGCALDFHLYGAELSSIVDPVKGGYVEYYPIINFWKTQDVCAAATATATTDFAKTTTQEMVRLPSYVIYPVNSMWIIRWFLEEVWCALDASTLQEQLAAFNMPRSNWAFVRPDLCSLANWKWVKRRDSSEPTRAMDELEYWEAKNIAAFKLAIAGAYSA